jgi:hypothetical protein
MFDNNPKFQIAYDAEGVKLYEPTRDTSYHTSRTLAANAQNIFSNAGVTKDLLVEIMQDMIRRCNSQNVEQLKTDIAILANNVLYRTKYPVDELCSLRMGAIWYFLEGEDPDTTDDFWINKKMDLAKEHPGLYAFFLSKGIESTRSYNELLDSSITANYFQTRKETLESLTPQRLTNK